MKRDQPPRDDYLVDAVAKACDLIRAFRTESERLSLKQLVDRTGLTSSRAFRLLYTLEQAGFIEKADSQRYRPRVRIRDKPRYRIGFAGQTQDSAFALEVAASLRAAAERANVELVEVDNHWSPSTAVRNAELLIEQNVDLAIEFQTFTSVASEVAAKFREVDVPLIAIDIPHPGAVFFGADNFRAGQMAGQELGRWARRNWGGRADLLVLLDIPAAGPSVGARLDGLVAGLREILPAAGRLPMLRLDARGTFSGGRSAMERAMRPGARVLVGAANDPSALGALDALRLRGELERCAVVGQGASSEGRAELRRPKTRLIGSVAYFPECYGGRLVNLALEILAGRPTPPAVFVRHRLVTPANIGAIYPSENGAETNPARVAALR